MNINRLSEDIFAALRADATFIVANAQRQTAVRTAWAAVQRERGMQVWSSPRIFTFAQFCERRLQDHWAAHSQPDQLLPPGAEWSVLREWRREAGGTSEARALLAAVRTLYDWDIPRSRAALAGSAEGDLLLETLAILQEQARTLDARPLREWIGELPPSDEPLFAFSGATFPRAVRAALQKLGAKMEAPVAPAGGVAVAAAQDDDHELELIAAWCRAELERHPASRLLIVDARLRQRRRQYERVLSQALAPREWLSPGARAFSTIFAIEGGQPLTDFPLITHALLSLRLLTDVLRLDELVFWLRLPFLDAGDAHAGAAIEASLRGGHALEYGAPALAGFLERAPGDAARALAARLRQALALLAGEPRTASQWAPRLLGALHALGWHGSRPLRSDEHQTVVRFQALLDEYAALGAWLPRSAAADAVATLTDFARERSFDPASVAAPITLTDDHTDPVVRYDGIWVAGLDAAQWPPPPRPDVFIPLRLQVAAGLPAASAAAQTAAAHRSLAAWRAATSTVICSWAALDGEAHRTASPLLARLSERTDYVAQAAHVPLAIHMRQPQLETLEDVNGISVDVSKPVAGGVRPLELQSECGFHAYAELRLEATRLEAPVPGIDPRDRGRLLHKALELVWTKLHDWFNLSGTDEAVRLPAIDLSVEAAVAYVYRGSVPPQLRFAVEREKLRLARLIERLLKAEIARPAFTVDRLETRREVGIAGGTFDLRIDRIDSIEGGGYAILDYKSGGARAPRWDEERLRDPQLLAYLLAERGRDVQALANVSLTRGRARFLGRSSRARLLPGVSGLPGMNPNEVSAQEIDAAWQGELDRWLHRLQLLAATFLAGEAPVEPAPDVCRNCHLTVLCRRVELAAADIGAADHDHE